MTGGGDEPGGLKIVKVDSSSNQSLKGVVFLIKCVECTEDPDLEGTYLKTSSGSVTYETSSILNWNIRLSLLGRSYSNPPSTRKSIVNSIGSKYKFTTDANGTITISGLKPGKYQAIELYNPNEGYAIYPVEEENITVNASTTTTATIGNSKVSDDRGNLNIYKVGINGEDREPFEGVQIEIKCDTSYSETIILDGYYVVYNTSTSKYEYVNSSTYKSIGNGSSKYTLPTTDANGYINIENLYTGKYDLKEVYSPYSNKYDSSWEENNVTISKGVTKKVVAENERIKSNIGRMRIVKRDILNKNIISGATFTIQYKKSGEEYNGYYLTISDGKAVYNKSKTTIDTNSSGEIYIEDLYPGEYIINEIKAPDGYSSRLDDLYSGKLTIEEGEEGVVEIEVTNIPVTTLIINKKDLDTGIPLSGFKFKVKLEKKLSGYDDYAEKYIGKYVSKQDEKIVYTDKETEATEFESGEDGIIRIEGLIPGQYTITEVGQSKDKEGYKNGYDGKDRNNSPIVKENVEVKANEENKVDVENPLKEIDITGFVWEDFVDKKSNTYNSLYNINDPDSKLEGITVRLKRRNPEETIAETTTTINLETDRAEYKFTNVKVEDLPNLYVEFEYDGVIYTNVEKLDTYIDDDGNEQKYRTSKAEESNSDREELNKKFATIEDNGTIDDNIGVAKSSNVEETAEIKYERKSYQSIVKSIGDPNDQNEDLTKIVATTSISNEKNEVKTSYLSNCYKNYYDIISMRLNSGTLEELGDSTDTCYWDEDTKRLTIGYVNLGLVKRAQPDIAIKSVDLDTVKTTVNGYEYTYRYADRKTYFTEDTVEYDSESARLAAKFSNKYYEGKYTRAYYTSDLKAAVTEDKIPFETYMTYSIEIVNQSGSLYMKANNIVDYFDKNYEIFAITCEGQTIEDKEIGFNNEVYYVSGEDSENNTIEYKAYKIDLSEYIINPGKKITVMIQFKLNDEAVERLYSEDNMVLNNIAEISSYSTYSDENAVNCYAGIDCDSAPENATPGKKETYEDDTDYASALKLELGGDRIISGIVFEDNPMDIEKEKVNAGSKRLGDGKYVVGENPVQNVTVELINKVDNIKAKLYSSGDNNNENITGEDGKYTITGVIPGEYYLQFTYTDENAKEMKINEEIQDVDKWKSTIITSNVVKNAMGSENEKWYLENEIKNGTYSIAVDENPIRTEELTMNLSTKDETSTKNAKSPNINIGVEYTTEDESYYNSEELISNYNKMYFGIIQRPKTDIQLTKEISNIKISLQNEQNLINGNPTKELKYVRDMDASSDDGSSNVQAEMDSTLIYSSTMNITYKIKVINMSELDYNTSNYYYYGIKEEKDTPVTTTVTKVVDYLNSSLILDSKENITIHETLDNLYGYITKEVKNSIGNYTILEFGNSTPLEVEDSYSIEYSVSRLLSNSDDDLKYDNHAEILEISNVTGTPQSESIPGNYVPGKSSVNNEKDGGGAIISIVPSTGEDKSSTIQYIVYTSIGLIILAGGIFLIKKKIL